MKISKRKKIKKSQSKQETIEYYCFYCDKPFEDLKPNKNKFRVVICSECGKQHLAFNNSSWQPGHIYLVNPINQSLSDCGCVFTEKYGFLPIEGCKWHDL